MRRFARSCTRIGKVFAWLTAAIEPFRKSAEFIESGDKEVQPLADDANNQDGEEDGVYYFLKDHLSRTTEVVKPDGTVTYTSCTAWGETRSSRGDIPTDKLCTGQEKSSNSGLYFYQSHWYSSNDLLAEISRERLSWSVLTAARGRFFSGFAGAIFTSR